MLTFSHSFRIYVMRTAGKQWVCIKGANTGGHLFSFSHLRKGPVLLFLLLKFVGSSQQMFYAEKNLSVFFFSLCAGQILSIYCSIQVNLFNSTSSSKAHSHFLCFFFLVFFFPLGVNCNCLDHRIRKMVKTENVSQSC